MRPPPLSGIDSSTLGSTLGAILGGPGHAALPGAGPTVEHVHRDRAMRRLLAFAGRSIDDVVNCPVARREVISYFRIGRQMERLAEVDALERQWNALRSR